MKKLCVIFTLAIAQIVSAQQLANSTFDGTWVNCYPWEAGSYVKNAKGTQPEGWCISNVSQSVLPEVGEEITPGANGSGKAVKLNNVSALSNNVPGYITLGTAYATAETNFTSVRNADGGVFGGINFTYHPDAVRLTYKHDVSNGAENMTVIAYLWKGTWTQKDVPSNTAVGLFGWGSATKVTMTDRIHNILGKTTATGGNVSHTDDAALIASVEHYENTQQSNWTTKEIPLNYGDYAGKPVKVEKLNIVICSTDMFGDRTKIKKDNSVSVDDVVLVYWHALSALTYQGSTLNFSENTTSYDLSDVTYDDAKLSYTVKGQAATATKSYNTETAVLTIRVEGEDIASNPSSFTEYTIQFKAPAVGPVVVSSKTYTEDLYLTVAGKTSDKQVAQVLVETLDNGKINFVLKNFVLGSGNEAMPVGNIAVDNIEVAKDGSFTFKDGIELLAGDDPAYEGLWQGPAVTQMLGGSVPLDLSGKFIDENHVVVYISIDLGNIMGYAVDVHLGYARATMEVIAEAQYGTFCAPYSVNIPAGVTAYTVPSAANGLLTLTEVTGSISANTPVLLFAENGLNKVDFFGIAESGTHTVGLLTGVYEDTPAPVGSYVLQKKDNGKVGFYQVAAGKQPTVKANRCYLTAPDVKVKAFYFNEEDATGIENVNVNDNLNEGVEAIYNVAGQRINKLQKGINIINGKKILK